MNPQSTLPSTVEILAILPEISLVILLGAVLAYDRLLKPAERRRIGLVAAWGSFFVLLLTVGVWLLAGEPDVTRQLGEDLLWGGMIRHDPVTLVFRIMFFVAILIVSLISLDVERLQRGEYYALLAATVGFSLMAASADMIMLFLALETASISLYILAGFITDSRRSTEAGMKYFVYGAFASAVMLYGLSLIYGITTQSNIYVVAALVQQSGALPADINGIFLLASVLVIAGFGF